MTCKKCYGKGYFSYYSGGAGGFTDFGNIEYIKTEKHGIRYIDCECRKKEEIETIQEETIKEEIIEKEIDYFVYQKIAVMLGLLIVLLLIYFHV